jgi:hypothetical protein
VPCMQLYTSSSMTQKLHLDEQPFICKKQPATGLSSGQALPLHVSM